MSSLLVLPPDILHVFDSHAEALYAKIQANDEQSRTLAELRDTLLPKLISGQLRVPDVERFVAEVAS